MPSESVKYSIMGDSASALAAQRKVIEAQDKTIDKLKQTGRESKSAGKDGAGAMKQFKGAALEVVSALGMGVGVGAMLSKGLGLIKEYAAGLRELGATAERVGQEAVALGMMQRGGEARSRVIQAAVLGAQYGIPRGPALSAIQALQAQTGGWKEGTAAAEEAFKLAALAGVPMEAAQTAVSAGVGAGLTPAKAATLPYAAGEVSALSPAELARISPAIPFYGAVKGGPGEAYGFAAALSKTFKEDLTTYTRAAATALTAPPTKGKWGRYAAGLTGSAEGDLLAMLGALEERGITNTKALGQVGLIEKREAAAIAELLRDLDETRRVVEEVRRKAAEPGLIERRRAGAEVGFPELQRQRAIAERRARGQAVLDMPVTPEARALMDKAATILTERQIRAEAMARAGYGWLIEDKAGMEAGVTKEYLAQWGDNLRLLKYYALGKMPGGGRHAPYTFRQAYREIEAEERRKVRGSERRNLERHMPALPMGAPTFDPTAPITEPLMPARPGAVEVPGVVGALGAPAQQAGGEARSAAMPATQAIRGIDERAEQRHSELVHEVRRVADGLERMESASGTAPMPEVPAR